MIINQEFIDFLEKNRINAQKNPDSLLGEFEEFLTVNDICMTLDPVSFHKEIKGRFELCDGIMDFYERATLNNEKISFLEDLYAIGYDKNKLTEIVLEVFFARDYPSNLWEYGDLLYSMKRYMYLPEYIRIIQDKSYGSARQMVVLLVGKSKKEEVIPILKELLNDPTVEGHALDALTNFKGEEIEEIMNRYTKCKVTWIRNTAKKYLKKHKNKE